MITPNNSLPIDSTDLLQEELTYPPNIQLPNDIQVRLSRGFNFGTQVQWIQEAEDTDKPDFGIVIGKFLGYAPHLEDWGICHLIWLDENSPSRQWTRTDIAWIEDLKQI